LRVSAGAKINPRRCQNIGVSTIWGVTRQGHLNNSPVCASVLREIRYPHEMIARHCDFKNRIVAGDDFAFKRIGEGNCCGSKKRENDEISDGEHFHGSILNPICILQLKLTPVAD
jgi:hypothetical protein